jgi:hypothetical protein
MLANETPEEALSRLTELAKLGLRPKNLTAASLLKEWLGSASSIPVADFFNNDEAAAQMGNLDESNMKQIVKLKVVGHAADFLYSRPELMGIGVTYKALRAQFEHRFKEKLPDNYHYNQLQRAPQNKGESPEMFADRCKSLSLKTVRYSDIPEEKRIIGEEAESRLLAAYCASLRGEVGRQVRMRLPKTMQEAIQLAVTVNNLEQREAVQERGRDQKMAVSKHVFTAGSKIICYSCNKRGHRAKECWKNRNHIPQKQQTKAQPARQADHWDRRINVKCFNCKRRGHFARECKARVSEVPHRQRREDTRTSDQGNRSASSNTHFGYILWQPRRAHSGR